MAGRGVREDLVDETVSKPFAHHCLTQRVAVAGPRSDPAAVVEFVSDRRGDPRLQHLAQTGAVGVDPEVDVPASRIRVAPTPISGIVCDASTLTVITISP